MVPKNIFLILAISLIFINLSLAQTEEYKGGFAAGQQDAIVAGLGEIGWNCGYYGGVDQGSADAYAFKPSSLHPFDDYSRGYEAGRRDWYDQNVAKGQSDRRYTAAMDEGINSIPGQIAPILAAVLIIPGLLFGGYYLIINRHSILKNPLELN